MDHPHLRNRSSSVALLLGVVAVVVLGACSGSGGKPAAARHFNPLSSTTTSSLDPHALHVPAGFQQPDTRFISLSALTGKPLPNPPIPVAGGNATISGVVTGPSGPVAGATVRIERWVGSASGSIQVSTDGNGHYGARGLLGGRYKVRAWQQPALATFTAVTGFVANNGQFSANVTMEQRNSFVLQLASVSGGVFVGQPFGVVVLVTQEMVDPNGIVQSVPVPNDSVSLSVSGSLVIAGANPVPTGPAGTASWTLTCQAPGSYTATASTAEASQTIGLPGCQAVPTTVPPPTVLPLAVGQSFTVPAGGPYPAGTYQASAPNCSTTYQVYVGGNWQPAVSSGPTLTLAGPGQSFAAAAGSPPCTYTRTS